MWEVEILSPGKILAPKMASGFLFENPQMLQSESKAESTPTIEPSKMSKGVAIKVHRNERDNENVLNCQGNEQKSGLFFEMPALFKSYHSNGFSCLTCINH